MPIKRRRVFIKGSSLRNNLFGEFVDRCKNPNISHSALNSVRNMDINLKKKSTKSTIIEILIYQLLFLQDTCYNANQPRLLLISADNFGETIVKI